MNNYIFSIPFQLYKISNVDVKDSAIYVLGPTLYNLLQMEDGIMAAAASIKADEYERKFMENVNAAIDDYGAFLNQVFDDGDLFKIELMTNFQEFFETCLNCKKTELESGAHTSNSDDGSGPSDVSGPSATNGSSGLTGAAAATSTSNTSASEEKQNNSKPPRAPKDRQKKWNLFFQAICIYIDVSVGKEAN